MLARRLTRKGYVVNWRTTAKELLKRVLRDAVDLVLLDIEMPDHQRLDALKTLAVTNSAAELPIIWSRQNSQTTTLLQRWI